jgi:SAM-dependent methyltransferase
VRSFVDPPAGAGWFDAAVCVGNSLALVPSVEVVRRVIAAMLAAVRPGGVCIAQVVNLWRMPEGPTNWQKCQRLRHGDEDQIVIKGIHRVGEHGHVDFIELRLRGEEFTSHLRAATFIGLREAELLDAAADAGGRDARLWGTFQEAPYDPATSPDLILECYRA